MGVTEQGGFELVASLGSSPGSAAKKVEGQITQMAFHRDGTVDLVLDWHSGEYEDPGSWQLGRWEPTSGRCDFMADSHMGVSGGLVRWRDGVSAVVQDGATLLWKGPGHPLEDRPWTVHRLDPERAEAWVVHPQGRLERRSTASEQVVESIDLSFLAPFPWDAERLLAFDEPGRRLVVLDKPRYAPGEASLQLWDLETGRRIADTICADVVGMVPTCDLRQIVVLSTSELLAFDAETLALRRRQPLGPTEGAVHLNLRGPLAHPTRPEILVFGYGFVPQLWDLTRGELRRAWPELGYELSWQVAVLGRAPEVELVGLVQGPQGTELVRWRWDEGRVLASQPVPTSARLFADEGRIGLGLDDGRAMLFRPRPEDVGR